MKLFDWALKRKGFPLSAAEKYLNSILKLDTHDFHQYQEEKKREIFAFHKEHNNFYKSFLLNKGVSEVNNWTDIPVIKKADMQIPVADRLSDGFTLKNVYINNTSGSSGTPFFFAKDRFAHALTWASIKHRFGWHHIDFNSSWQARFYGIPLGKIKYYKERGKDWLSHRVRFPVFNLEDEVCALYVKKFKRIPFEYLNGYTSSLVLFAKYCVSNRIVLKAICPSLKVCVTTSEVCNSIDRKIMEQGFGVKVVNEYGAAELDLLAFEDAEGDWVLNEENLFIEILDDSGKAIPDGSPGKMIVTALHNKAMPFIRYELGDIGVIKPGQLKGFRRILSELTGRTNDIALLPSGKKVPGLTFYYVTKTLLEQGGTMKEFVIKQIKTNSFELEYAASTPIGKEEEKKVREMMDVYLEPGLELVFKRSDKIERTTAGKLKQFQYEVQQEKEN